MGEAGILFANIGINELEKAYLKKDYSAIHLMVERLRADGLYIHINPLQEVFQPEGDLLKISPIVLIQDFLNSADYHVAIKEVGQGMGPKSLLELFKLPLAAVDFSAFGGTNFAKLELLRNDPDKLKTYLSLAHVGHTAEEMVEICNMLFLENKHGIKTSRIIISGGVKDFLDGYFLIKKSTIPAFYAQGAAFLKYALDDYDILSAHIKAQIEGLKIAYAYLHLKQE